MYYKIREHSIQEDHVIRDNSFRILFRAHNKSDLRIAETSGMLDHKTELNNNETVTKLLLK